jgi:hypothetical protein
MSIRLKKICTSLILAVFVFVSLAGSIIFFAQPSAAAGMPVTVTESIPDKTRTIKDKILRGLRISVVNAVVQTLNYFIRKVAYDVAVWAASGGKGQTPFAHTKSFGDYMKNVADEAAGKAIEALGKAFGLNLCKIPDARLDIALRLGLQFQYAAPAKPACSFSTFTKNWSASAFQSQYGSAGAIEKRFNASLKVEESDFGLYTKATEKIDNIQATQIQAKQLQRQEGQGYIAKTAPISGQVKTPATANKKLIESNTPEEKIKSGETSIGAGISSGLYENLMPTLKLFLNTLAGTMLKNYMQKGMLPFGITIGGGGAATSLEAQYEELNTGGQQAAQAMFSNLLVPQTGEIDRYDILSNFSNCTESPAPDNCVADENFMQAAREADVGAPITVAEAIEKNWLHGEWKLIPPDRLADNADKNCFTRAYCYANIKKLRAARVVPLGFEIAARNSNPDKPWTLKQVVDGFNDCNFIRDAQGKVVGILNDPVNKPFCHLIDPSWVLKAPASRCDKVAYGSSLVYANGPERNEECVDLKTCVAYDKDGNCSNYGYCAREKNIWRVDANKCDEQYRTCRAFQNSEGKTVSYLYRTLDTGFCTADNVGCTAYSLNKDFTVNTTTGEWKGYDADSITDLGENSIIHFNKDLSTSCGSGSAGCSAFQVASSTETNLYLKKAPYYLGCYDADINTAGMQWPQTTADLGRIEPAAECQNYSQACIPDEVNCNWYSPVTYAGDKVPGKFTPAQIVENQIVWNDQCDQRCSGYAAYREMPSNYSAGQAIDYVIPSSGSTCTAQEEGCVGFTNLSTTTGGMEVVEYYSYLRSCIAPDANRQKNFFTYEGSAVGGYQLKSFVLEKDATGASDQSGRAGGPKYFYRTAGDKQFYDSICNESVYKAGTADLDCRQFNDEQGTVYYRLLSKTIAVSSQCTPYRLNSSELAAPDTCFQDGEYRDGACFYMGLPAGVNNTAGVSAACSAAVNTCRAYKGNAGNNVKLIFSDNFEGVASASDLPSWNSTGNFSLSGESTHAGEHSMQGNNNLSKDLSLTPGKSYDLTFWAKAGAGQTISVRLDNGASFSFGAVGAGDVWQYYHLGPVELGGTATGTKLTFETGGQMFLDNVRLMEISDYLYLVKSTLSVDPVCDSNLDDNLPGEALGCAEYKNPDNASIYLTGFSYLCREGAIGCTAFYDTYNTPDDQGPRLYNVWFDGISGVQIKKTIGGNEYTCQVAVGQSGCYMNILGSDRAAVTAAGGKIVTSTVYISADTPSSTPIYLVANEDATCNEADLGCTNAGKETITPNGPVYADAVIKSDPATYDAQLCQSEAVGCNAYAYSDGTLYFKDPEVVGQKICAYKDKADINGTTYTGWFWKGVGVCENNTGKYCMADTDCSATGTVKCAGVDIQPCYPDYLKAGNIYDIWSYGTAGKYKNFVGECPAEQSGCTEFVDNNDNGKPYYIINNEELQAKVSECNGQVSEKAGCILFDQTDKPNKMWDTAASYLLSRNLNETLVAPTSSNSNNANTIIKVTRDRECSEWLQCRSSHRVWDQKIGAYKEVCDMIGRCDKSPEAAEKGDITNCDNWIDGLHEYSNQVMTEDLYRDRDISWKGRDLSGYTLLNMFPVEELDQVNFSKDNSNPQWRLAKRILCGADASTNCKPGLPNTYSCQTPGEPCGRIQNGTCTPSQICVENPDGTSADLNLKAPSMTCRAYPETDSPYPNTQNLASSQAFAGANKCQEISGISANKDDSYLCECDYSKVAYGDSLTKYWNYSRPNNFGIANKNGFLVKGAVGGLCVGGANDGKVCDLDADCGTDANPGTCAKETKKTQYIGWRGYCLESDISRSRNAEEGNFGCLTWYPIDTLNGAPDINGQNVEAGYVNPENGGRYYCLNGTYVGNNDFNYSLVTRPVGSSTVWGYTTTTWNKEFLSFGTSITLCPFCSELHDPPWNDNRSGQSSRGTRPANSLETVLTQQEIEKITIKVLGADNEDPLIGTAFEIWPNDYTAPSGSPQSVYSVETNGKPELNPGTAVVGRYLGKKNEFIWLYSSSIIKNPSEADTYVKPDGSICYGGVDDKALTCSQLSGNVFQAGTLKAKKSGQSASTMMSDEGLWDWNFDNSEICPGNQFGEGNWSAVRFRFDPNSGKFLGYNVFYCDESKGGGHLSFQVTFKKREICPIVADSSMDAVGADNSQTAPWTDRLWPNSNFQISNLYDNWSGTKFTNSINRSPFGSISQNTQPSGEPVVLSPITTMPKTEGCNPCPTKSGGVAAECECTYSLTKLPVISGFPYACVGPWPAFCVQTLDGGTTNISPSLSNSVVQSKMAYNRIFANAKDAFLFDYMFGYTPAIGTANKIPNITEEGDKNICYNRYSVGATGDRYQSDPCADSQKVSPPSAPKVFAVGDCLADKCMQGAADNITVNDQKPLRDVVFSTYLAPVNLKFYAVADKNQMPIKKVLVDWDDGSQTMLNGYYRNRKGGVDGTCSPTTHTCVVSSEKYVDFEKGSHVYEMTQAAAPPNYAGVYTGKKCSDPSQCEVPIRGYCAYSNLTLDKQCKYVLPAGLWGLGNDVTSTIIGVRACVNSLDCIFTTKGMCTASGTLGTVCTLNGAERQVLVDNYVPATIDTGKTCSRPRDCSYMDQCFSEEKAANFGEIAGRSCDNAYFRFDHVYQCLQGGTGWVTSTCPDANMNTKYGGCCVFQPKVQVKDNWGWCNGTCPGPDELGGPSPGDTGCYDKNWDNNKGDECGDVNSLTNHPYTQFSNSIIIAPKM